MLQCEGVIHWEGKIGERRVRDRRIDRVTPDYAILGKTWKGANLVTESGICAPFYRQAKSNLSTSSFSVLTFSARSRSLTAQNCSVWTWFYVLPEWTSASRRRFQVG